MAAGTGNLPNVNMVFTPFDILTAEEQNQLVENIEALADGSGIGDEAIDTQAIADESVTAGKIEDGAAAFPKYNQLIQAGVSSTINVPVAGTGGNAVTVTFPIAYTSPPRVVATLNGSSADDISVHVSTVTNTTATFIARKSGGTTYVSSVNWIAIGT